MQSLKIFFIGALALFTLALGDICEDSITNFFKKATLSSATRCDNRFDISSNSTSAAVNFDDCQEFINNCEGMAPDGVWPLNVGQNGLIFAYKNCTVSAYNYGEEMTSVSLTDVRQILFQSGLKKEQCGGQACLAASVCSEAEDKNTLIEGSSSEAVPGLITIFTLQGSV